MTSPTLLKHIIDHLYAPAGLHITAWMVPEPEGSNYLAHRFSINGKRVVFRLARITPTKTGAFVTLWKRPAVGGPIAPFTLTDPVDRIVVHAIHNERQGQFIFSPTTLVKQGVFAGASNEGKRALRVYPAWSHPVAKAAIASQQWQLGSFVEFTRDGLENAMRLRSLFD